MHGCHSTRSRIGILLVALVLAAALTPAAAQAATLPVTSLDDSGAGTLRGQLTAANATMADDVLDITVTGQINLATQLPSIASVGTGGRLTIQGPGAGLLDVHRGTVASILIFGVLAGADATISGVRISGGASPSQGGGVNNSGTLTLSRVEIIGNSAVSVGGGIMNAAGGVLNVNQSTISGNTAGASAGGGIASVATAIATIERTTISGNSTTADSGGGIRTTGTMTVRSSTIAGNTGAPVTIFAGKNVSTDGPTGVLNLQNTIIADAKTTDPLETPANCQASPPAIIVSQGFNLADDTGCSLTQPGDVPNVDPGLSPLAVNGSGTPTHAIAKTSSAVDRGLAGLAGGFDQRGLTRPADFSDVVNAAGGDGSDIGAFELQIPAAAPAPTPTTPAAPAKKCKKKGKKAGVSAKKCKKRKPKKK